MRNQQHQQPLPFQILSPTQHSQHPRIQPIHEVMQKLQQLSTEIEENPLHPSQHLKEYITIYVQNHNRSEEFFNLMCEHNMLAKLFTNGVSRPIYILQTFNLLLANTQHLHELVYIFSHPLFHNYLLINVQTLLQPITTTPNTLLATNECIQYYIQLIKTLVTKLQAQSTQCTLLKLFCNNKYSYFPLLANCIVLAVKRNVKEQLVRVTAQHCILQLVGIMARKKVGEYYFSNLHMLVFFYEIIHQTIEEQTQHLQTHDTTIKYLTDLLKAINLSQNHDAKHKSFLLFFTLFSNLLTFKFMKTPAPGLHLLVKFSSSLSEMQELRQMPGHYLTSVYFIFGKLLFNKYLSNITLSSIILCTEAISELVQLKDVNILKLLKTHYQKHPLTSSQIEEQKERNSYEEEQQKRDSAIKKQSFKFQTQPGLSFRNSMLKIRQQVFDKEHEHVMKQLQKYNLDNEEFLNLKQNFYKKAQTPHWFSGVTTLFKKINLFDIPSNEYLKRLSHLAAVKYLPEQPIKFLSLTLSPSAVYLYQFLKTKTKERYLFGQKTEDTEKIQISFNQNRDQFLCTVELFKVICNIAQTAICGIEHLWGQTDRQQAFQTLQQTYNPKLQHPGETYFTLHFRQYFQHSIFEYVCTSANSKPKIQITTKLIKYLYNLSTALFFHISEVNLNKVKAEALKLQKQLYSLINQKGFDTFCDYLQSQQEKHMVEAGKKQAMNVSVIKFDKSHSLEDSPKKINSNIRKKKTIFRSFSKSSSSKESPKKSSHLQQSQTLTIVQTKMLHLQLLRFLLNASNKSLSHSRIPLYKIFQNNFTKKYTALLSTAKDHEVLYQCQGVGFNSESDFECCFRVKVSFDEFAIMCELLHEQKLILKCNIKEFCLSQPYLKQHTEKPMAECEYLINLHPTSNVLGFSTLNKAIKLLNTVNEIKFGFRQIKDSAILNYLNRENQLLN